MSVTEVMVIETAASLYVWPNLTDTGSWMEVLLQAANMTKVSSIPIPNIRNGAARLIPMKSIPRYMTRPNADMDPMTADTTP